MSQAKRAYHLWFCVNLDMMEGKQEQISEHMNWWRNKMFISFSKKNKEAKKQ